MTDISSTSIFKNKVRILYCSSSTCPNRESVPEIFILYNSWVMNLGNKSNTQLCPLACQSQVESFVRCLSDRQVSLSGTEESPSRSPQKPQPFSWTWAATPMTFRLKMRHWLVFWPLPSQGSRSCGYYHHGRFWKRWHQTVFEDCIQSYFGFENRKHSHHTFHFTWPEMLSSDS